MNLCEVPAVLVMQLARAFGDHSEASRALRDAIYGPADVRFYLVRESHRVIVRKH